MIEGDVIPPAVVEAGGAGGLVAGHLLGDFQPSAVLQVGGDAGGPEGVAAHFGFNAGFFCPALDHAVDVGLGQGPGAEGSGLTEGCSKEEALFVLGNACGVNLLL